MCVEWLRERLDSTIKASTNRGSCDIICKHILSRTGIQTTVRD
eukprot:SAG25_NODE_7497_length_477_cov_1.568783_1_plen_42_part_10